MTSLPEAIRNVVVQVCNSVPHLVTNTSLCVTDIFRQGHFHHVGNMTMPVVSFRTLMRRFVGGSTRKVPGNGLATD